MNAACLSLESTLSASCKATQGLDSYNHILFLGPSQLNLHLGSHAPCSSSRTLRWRLGASAFTPHAPTLHGDTSAHVYGAGRFLFLSHTSIVSDTQKNQARTQGWWKYAVRETTRDWTCWEDLELNPPSPLPARGSHCGTSALWWVTV